MFVFFFNSSHLASASCCFPTSLLAIQSSATEIATFPSSLVNRALLKENVINQQCNAYDVVPNFQALFQALFCDFDRFFLDKAIRNQRVANSAVQVCETIVAIATSECIAFGSGSWRAVSYMLAVGARVISEFGYVVTSWAFVLLSHLSSPSAVIQLKHPNLQIKL